MLIHVKSFHTKQYELVLGSQTRSSIFFKCVNTRNTIRLGRFGGLKAPHFSSRRGGGDWGLLCLPKTKDVLSPRSSLRIYCLCSATCTDTQIPPRFSDCHMLPCYSAANNVGSNDNIIQANNYLES